MGLKSDLGGWEELGLRSVADLMCYDVLFYDELAIVAVFFTCPSSALKILCRALQSQCKLDHGFLDHSNSS